MLYIQLVKRDKGRRKHLVEHCQWPVVLPFDVDDPRLLPLCIGGLGLMYCCMLSCQYLDHNLVLLEDNCLRKYPRPNTRLFYFALASRKCLSVTKKKPNRNTIYVIFWYIVIVATT
jgi:hypothetical protein